MTESCFVIVSSYFEPSFLVSPLSELATYFPLRYILHHFTNRNSSKVNQISQDIRHLLHITRAGHELRKSISIVINSPTEPIALYTLPHT